MMLAYEAQIIELGCEELGCDELNYKANASSNSTKTTTNIFSSYDDVHLETTLLINMATIS